jgi:hypothetical protein
MQYALCHLLEIDFPDNEDEFLALIEPLLIKMQHDELPPLMIEYKMLPGSAMRPQDAGEPQNIDGSDVATAYRSEGSAATQRISVGSAPSGSSPSSSVNSESDVPTLKKVVSHFDTSSHTREQPVSDEPEPPPQARSPKNNH